MALLSTVRFAILATGILAPSASADIISDITTSESDEFAALQIKTESFWKPILTAAEEVKMGQHLDLYKEAEDIITKLPAENSYVQKSLRDALEHLKKADEVLFKQALNAVRVATEKLEVPAGGGGSSFSFLTGGQNFLKAAIQRFVGAGNYHEKVGEHVNERQGDILPLLRGASGASGNILKDTRLAQNLGFDVQKYDIYDETAPKTPQIAKDLADKIVSAAGETRHHFMQSITNTVNSITKDEQEKHEDASATVTKASLRGLHQSVALQEARIASRATSLQFSSLNLYSV